MRSLTTLLKKYYLWLAAVMLTLCIACVPALPVDEETPVSEPTTTHEPVNNPPVISGFTADIKVMVLSTSEITCNAYDRDSDTLTFIWSPGHGTVQGTGNNVVWTAPGFAGIVTVTVTVLDGKGGEAVDSVSIMVTDQPNRPPVIERFSIFVQYPRDEMTIDPDIPIIERENPLVKVSRLVDIECVASDPDDDNLTFTWEITAGKLAGEGAEIQWLAPTEPQRYIIKVTVTDEEGNQDTAKIAILKAYSEALIAKESNKNVRIDETKRSAPIILPKKMMEMLEYLSPEEKEKVFPGGKVFLPEKKPDPAKLVPIAGRKSDN